MTSSDCLSTNNLHPRLSTKSRLNLPVPSVHNVKTDEIKMSTSTPTSTTPSPNIFYTSLANNQIRFPQPPMFSFPRPPAPSATALSRRNFDMKPPEQDLLDNSFFRAFNLEQQKEENVTDNKINIGITLRNHIFIKNSFY